MDGVSRLFFTAQCCHLPLSSEMVALSPAARSCLLLASHPTQRIDKWRAIIQSLARRKSRATLYSKRQRQVKIKHRDAMNGMLDLLLLVHCLCISWEASSLWMNEWCASQSCSFALLKHDPVTNPLQITQRPCNSWLDLLLINLHALLYSAG